MKVRELVALLSNPDIDPDAEVSMYVSYAEEYDEEIKLKEVLFDRKVGPTLGMNFEYNFPEC